MKNNKPRILFYDIETSHNVAAIFDLFSEHIVHDSIIQEKYIICVAFKWQGSNKVHTVSVLDDPVRFAKNPNDDYHVVKYMHDVISSADAIVAHYGDKFDIKVFNSRAIYHGLPPLPPVIQIDTHKMARKKFKFNCNRLDYLGKYFKLGSKIKTDITLWLRCLKGERRAIQEMVDYNKGDVVLLEKIYNRLVPYVSSGVNINLFMDTKDIACTHCGSSKLQQRGFRYTKTRKYKRMQCQDCGSWSSSPVNYIQKNKIT